MRIQLAQAERLPDDVTLVLGHWRAADREVLDDIKQARAQGLVAVALLLGTRDQEEGDAS